MDATEKILHAAERFGMFIDTRSVLVGLSGGADSVCLLLNLLELAERLGLDSIRAIHINHCLRGEESDSDEVFCIRLCHRLGVPLSIIRVNAAEYAENTGLSIETAARELRYTAFEEACEVGGVIATAHSLSDNAETMLFNITRGTAMRGLCGIPPIRENIVRPLIFCTRTEIEDYLKKKGQTYVTDSTNLSDDYSRNSIRLNVIPRLKEINPAFESCVHNLITTLYSENDYLEQAATDALDSEKPLTEFHDAIRRRAIALFLRRSSLPCEHGTVMSIDVMLFTDGKLNICRDTYVIASGGRLTIGKGKPEIPPAEPVEIDAVQGENEFGWGKIVILEKISEENADNSAFVNRMLTNNCVNCVKIQGKAVLRNRRDGDKIKLMGKAHTQTVKNLFNRGVSLLDRDRTAMLCDDEGLFWIEGFGCAERVRADDDTPRENILRIVVRERKSDKST